MGLVVCGRMGWDGSRRFVVSLWRRLFPAFLLVHFSRSEKPR